MKFLSQFLYQQALATSSKLYYKILLRLRGVLLRLCDPLITTTFRGYTLTMPSSHTIFLNQKLYPFYDMRLQTLAQYLCAKDGRLAMVDVGANIGDTAVFSQVDGASYLLIEGEQTYAALIPANLRANLSAPLSQHTSTQNLECMTSWTTSDFAGGGGETINSSIFARHF